MQPVRGGVFANPQVKQVLDWIKTQINSKGIVDEFHDDLGFYAKFANDLIVQGGALTESSTQTITFLTHFSGTAYSLLALPVLADTGMMWYETPREMTGTRTTSSVSVWVNTPAAARSGNWLAIGY